MTNNLPVRKTNRHFIFHSDEFDYFPTVDELNYGLDRLRNWLDRLDERMSVIYMIPTWPPEHILFESAIGGSLTPTAGIYTYLRDMLEPSGYSVLSVQLLSVIEHVYKHNTVIMVPDHARLYALQ